MLNYVELSNSSSDDNCNVELSKAYSQFSKSCSPQARRMAYSTPFSQPSGSAGMYSSMYLKGSGMARWEGLACVLKCFTLN